MIVLKIKLVDYIKILEKEDGRSFQSDEETLICVSDADVSVIGLHLLPAKGFISLAACESWFGKYYRRWIDFIGNSKQFVEVIAKELRRKRLSLKHYCADALCMPALVHGPKEFYVRPRSYTYPFSVIAPLSDEQYFIDALQKTEYARNKWVFEEGILGDVRKVVDEVGRVLFSRNLVANTFARANVMNTALAESLALPTQEGKLQFCKELVDVTESIRHLSSLTENSIIYRAAVAYCARTREPLSSTPVWRFAQEDITSNFNIELIRFCAKIGHPHFDEQFFFPFMNESGDDFEPNIAADLQRWYDRPCHVLEELDDYEELAKKRCVWLEDGFFAGKLSCDLWGK